jgi:SPP1 family phage portal protein
MKKMYTVPVGSEPTRELIQQAIDFNEKRKGRFDKLNRYYDGEHDILRRTKDDGLANNRIVINHAQYIADVNTAYLLGIPVDYQSEEDIDFITEEYAEQGIGVLDNDIGLGVAKAGRHYEYVYSDQENNVRSIDIDARNCIVAYDNTVEHKPVFAVIYNRDSIDETSKEPEPIIVADAKSIYTYKGGKDLTLEETLPHSFGNVPVVEYVTSSDGMGDFEQVLTLIDAYNLLQSDRVNDKEQLVEAILAIFGFDVPDEDAKSVRRNRMISNIPTDGDVRYITREFAEQSIEVLKESLERNIHKISKTPNFNDENFSGNSSGVAIRYKLLTWEQATLTRERNFERGLRRRFQLYNYYFNKLSKAPLIPVHKVDMVFKRALPMNELEISQMVNNLQGMVSMETLLGQVPFVKDASKEMESVQEERLTSVTGELPQFGTLEAALGDLEERGEVEATKTQESLLSRIRSMMNG